MLIKMHYSRGEKFAAILVANVVLFRNRILIKNIKNIESTVFILNSNLLLVLLVGLVKVFVVLQILAVQARLCKVQLVIHELYQKHYFGHHKHTTTHPTADKPGEPSTLSVGPPEEGQVQKAGHIEGRTAQTV